MMLSENTTFKNGVRRFSSLKAAWNHGTGVRRTKSNRMLFKVYVTITMEFVY
jgi:hypothetical protein